MRNMRPAPCSLAPILVILLFAIGSGQVLHATDHPRLETQAAVLVLQGAAGMDLSMFVLPPGRASREIEGGIDAGIGLGYAQIQLLDREVAAFAGPSHTVSLLGIVGYKPPLETRFNIRVSLRYGLAISGFRNELLVTQPAIVLAPALEVVTQTTAPWTYGLSVGLRGVNYAVVPGSPAEVALSLGFVLQREIAND